MVFQTVERDTESTLVACSQKLQEIGGLTFCLYASEAPGLRYVLKLIWAYWNKAIDIGRTIRDSWCNYDGQGQQSLIIYHFSHRTLEISQPHDNLMIGRTRKDAT